jgi:hypothetical protein
MVIPIPIKGYSEGFPVDASPPATGGYMLNVRPQDVLEGRIRLGQRPGQDKWSTTQIGAATQPIVAMVSVGVSA